MKAVGIFASWTLGICFLVASEKHAVLGDLPTHCMGDEFLGEWDVKITEPTEKDELHGLEEVCGHARPDDFIKAMEEKDGFENWYIHRKSLDVPVKNFRICVPFPNQTKAKICPMKDPSDNPCASESVDDYGCQPITFSLLYDEGFYFSTSIFDNVPIKVVLLFKYGVTNKHAKEYPEMSKLNQYTSYCDETISGVYSAQGSQVENGGKFYRGCAVAKKTTFVKPHSSEMRSHAKSTNMEDLVAHNDYDLLQIQESEQDAAAMKAQARVGSRGKARMDAFLDSKFQISKSFIEQINKMDDLGWTASEESASVFSGLSYRAALQQLGISEATQGGFRMEDYRDKYLTMNDEASDALLSSYESEDASISEKLESSGSEAVDSLIDQVSKHKIKSKVLETGEELVQDSIETACALEHLPANFDWTEVEECPGVIPGPQNQGSCGSCYAFAGATASTARLRIAKHPSEACRKGAAGPGDSSILDVELSPQSILDCSYLNQGCKGGYPALVGYHAYAEGLYDKRCDPYSAESQQCKLKSDSDDHCKPYFAKDFGYAGGAYGYGPSMHGMMVELLQNGPLSIAIDAPPELQAYKSGVFRPLWHGHHGKAKRDTILGRHSYWQKTNHAVTLLGWKTIIKPGKKPVIAWHIMNSWGEKWGDHGTFYIPAGTDEIAIETMPVTITFIDGPATNIAKDKIDQFAQCVSEQKKKNSI